MKRLLRQSVNLIPSRARYWIKSMPGIALLQRWLVNSVLSGEPFVHVINSGPARGLRFEVMLPNDKMIWSGTFEPEFAEALARGVTAGDVCYDIGGYRGYMSGILALAGASRVIVFEPLAENVRALKKLRELNPELPLQIQQCAVGKDDGEIGFKVMPDRSMGKIASSGFQRGKEAVEEIRVPITKLDTLLSEGGLPVPNLVKIDVEGAEIDVLDGATKTLKELTPKVFLEAHSRALANECTSRLRVYGYVVQQLESGEVAAESARHLVARRK